jgi:large subunit ribosomal protein L28
LRATRRRWNPNLQKIRIQEGTTIKRVNVCASCLKAFKVQKAPPRVRPATAEGTPA